MNIIRSTIIVLLILMVTACNEQIKEQPIANQSSEAAPDKVKNTLRAHIEFLADDKLKGRNTGSDEYEIAARYVASHFLQYGLTPAGENESWYQTVPFTKSTPDKNAAEMIIHANGSDIPLKFPEQFISGSSAISVEDEIRGQVVFVGYGITSTTMNHDDYSGLDVKGKIVAILTGKPASWPSEEGAHLSSSSVKTRLAADNGAIGIITLHTTVRDKVRTFEKVIPYAGRPSFSWQMKEGGVFGNIPAIKGTAYVSKETGIELFAAGGYDLTEIFKEVEADKIPTGFAMDVGITLKRKSSHENIYSSNVVAVLEGSDPALKNEYVVYSAHLDHIGDKGHGDEADHINNGALDNASGIAIMLETARRFSEGVRPKRSILFVAVTAEEKGLLGSNYFAHYPTVAIESMAATINLDMPLILYPFADVVAFGAQHSTLANFVERAITSQGLKLSPDPMPEQAIFVRSDHYSFVKQGVPSIFLMPGFTSSDPAVNGAEVFGKFFSQHYHQPSDDTTLPIDYDAGAMFTTVNFNIGEEIANSKYRPQWNEGDYFGELFSRD